MFYEKRRSPDPGDGSSGSSNPEPDKQDSDAQDYINQIKNLKESTVSKEKYEQLQKEKKELLQALVDGKQIASEESKQEDPEEIIAAARKIIFEEPGKHSNLEIAKATLALYNENKKKGVNIFLPNSPSYRVDAMDVESSERVAQALEHCIEYADGNNENFNAEFTRILKEPPVVTAAKNNRLR